MKSISPVNNEKLAADAFSRQSEVFDKLYTGNTIIQYKRQRVRNQVAQYLPQGGTILELNSGTGEDAIYFAQQLSCQVHATDISVGMQEVLKQKVFNLGLQNKITTELCSFTQLHLLKNKGPYDMIFSNFGGLNCTGDLDRVLASFDELLKPGGVIILVIISKFCLWESLLIFKGKFRTATRRWFRSKGTNACIERQYFKCWYYNPSYIVKLLNSTFELLNLEGLCVLVPPSYIDNFAEKHAALFKILKALENRLKGTWPWKHIGDYFIISMKKK